MNILSSGHTNSIITNLVIRCTICKRFIKSNGKLCNVVKYKNQNSSNSQIKYYEPRNTYNQTTPEFHSCIYARYY